MNKQKEDYFTFKKEKDNRINQIIMAEKLPIGTMKYEVWLGADIVFEKDKETGNWNFKIYKRIQGITIEVPIVIAALVSITRREKQWYKPTNLPMKVEVENFLKEQGIKNGNEI